MKESDQLLTKLSEKWGSTCLLGFSRGKDSIVSWLQLRKYFKYIYPYYLTMIPEELSFETESLAYYEKFFGCKILRFVSPSFSRMINEKVLQKPDNLPKLDAHGLLQRFDYQDVQNYVKDLHGLPLTLYTGLGVTMYDSFIRRNVIIKNGPINHTKREFYPIYDWKRSEIFEETQKAGILLPADYNVWGKTFDGVDYRFARGLKDNYPGDYAKMEVYFPLMDLEMIRYEQV
jgi:hypothetical protein